MSLNVDDLWIGDKLRLLSSGKVGTFEGKVSSTIAKVRLLGYIIQVPVSDLEIYKEPPLKVGDLLKPKKIAPIPAKPTIIPDALDLHIEVLDPSMQNQLPERILDFQIRKAKQYIEAAIQKRKYKIMIIHGKGTGVLKTEIKHLIKSYDNILFTHEMHNGGAIELLFNYE